MLELKKQYDIKTVVNLRGFKAEEDWFQEEQQAIQTLGLSWYVIRISGRKPPDALTIEKLFQVFDNPDNYPILVHCQGGVHRTGLVVALYRIRIQEWSNQEALLELENNWFDWTLVNRQALKDYIQVFR